MLLYYSSIREPRTVGIGSRPDGIAAPNTFEKSVAQVLHALLPPPVVRSLIWCRSVCVCVWQKAFASKQKAERGAEKGEMNRFHLSDKTASVT